MVQCNTHSWCQCILNTLVSWILGCCISNVEVFLGWNMQQFQQLSRRIWQHKVRLQGQTMKFSKIGSYM